MKIEHIRKTGKNKYEILLENDKIKTYDTLMLKYQIALKKELSDELILKIKEETKKAEAYDKVMMFLNRKLRSEKETRTFLKKGGIEEDMIEDLKKQGFFDDKKYIEAYIHDRFSFSPDGPHKIKEELLKQDFDYEKVALAIEKIEESKTKEKLEKLIAKKMNVYHKYSEKYCKQKILESMQQLGYQKEMIECILDNYHVDHSTILEAEARKLYQKYCSKKSGNELILLLKQKLYQKQYPMEDINDVIEKIINRNLV